MKRTDRDPFASFFSRFPFTICPKCKQTNTYLTPPEKASCPQCGPIPCVVCGEQADVTTETKKASDLCNRCRSTRNTR